MIAVTTSLHYALAVSITFGALVIHYDLESPQNETTNNWYAIDFGYCICAVMSLYMVCTRNKLLMNLLYVTHTTTFNSPELQGTTQALCI
jgi:hypothetical protein